MHRIVLLLGCAALMVGVVPEAWSAAAEKPAPAQTRLTPDTARVHLGPADGGTDAYVASPTGQTPVPAVIVIQEWWGLNDQIREMARRFARQGYVAIVPDLYHGKVASDPERAHELSRSLDQGQALRDLMAAAAWLRTQTRTAKSKIGVIGFCLGGGLSLQYALNSPQPVAAVMFYGSPETDPQKLAALRVPLQGHFGAEDQGISVDRVEAFKAALKKAGKSAEIYVYPGAGHAFMNESRPSFHADAARQAWARTLAFFQKYLKT